MKNNDIISKFKQVSYIECDYSDIEELIQRFYGFTEYNLVSAEELSNDCSVSYTLTGEIADWELEDVIEMTKTKEPMDYRTRNLLEYMCAEGVLVPGNYLIQISW